MKILPSLLAADFGCLAAEARRAEAAGADELHLDIMDGHFVPNLSMGPDVVRMTRRAVRIPLSVHLMLTSPHRYAERFIEAGATSVLIHVEAESQVGPLLRRIRELGARPGVTLNPATPADSAFPFLEDADVVLCMTVNPGYGGQKFMSEVLPKIEAIRDRMTAQGTMKEIMVDGGINTDTAWLCAQRGANSFVAGVFLFNAADMAAEILRMRERLSGEEHGARAATHHPGPQRVPGGRRT